MLWFEVHWGGKEEKEKAKAAGDMNACDYYQEAVNMFERAVSTNNSYEYFDSFFQMECYSRRTDIAPNRTPVATSSAIQNPNTVSDELNEDDDASGMTLSRS